MTTDELFAKFKDNTYPNNCPKFDAISKKLSNRPALHAFLLLDTLVPAKHTGDMMISAAQHDQIWLGVDVDALAAVITDNQVLELVACGVFFSDEESLSMFV